mgnify:CR=1 FL=1
MAKLKTLKNKLDRVVSEYVRKRDERDGVFTCVTCCRTLPISEADAGHFVKRGHSSTRWLERNINAQCRRCNRFQDGEQYLHGKAIDKKWGEGTADELIRLGKQVKKWTESELRELLSEYQLKLEGL